MSTTGTRAVDVPLTVALTPAAGLKPPSILPTLNDDGSRRWLRPKPSPGRLLQARRIVAYVLIAIFTLIPYIHVGGKPLVLLDIAARRFTIFSYTFYPHDTLLLAFLLVGVFLSIFLITALAGRVWCGWACPQTVYMEFVYRPIERFFDGTPGRARSAFQQSGTARALKYAAFFVVSCYLAHTFLAYFVGVEQLSRWVTQSPLQHPTPFLVMAVVTGLMMFDFSFFREQVCLVACPYGRFQSVLLDRNSVIVSYDARRGEPRGRKVRHGGKPAAEPSGDVALPLARTGDCVDCTMCVQTCPTGIDIRNGLQMECINCAQCIDACNAVMRKLNRPEGLIRYSSQAAMSGETRKFIRPRVVLYPLLLSVVLSGFLIVLLGKPPADITLIHTRGQTYVPLEGGLVGNHARVKIVNRTETPQVYTLGAEGEGGPGLRAQSNPATLLPGEMREIPVVLTLPVDRFERGKADIRVTVTSEAGYSRSVAYQLKGPANSAAMEAVRATGRPAEPRSEPGVGPAKEDER